MKITEMPIEDLESMSYTEIAEAILTEEGSAMKIVDIFKKICTLLNLSNSEFENKVADFFELISTDKNFIVLEKGFCDLRKKHTPKLVIEEDEDDSSDVEVDQASELDENEEQEENDDIYYDNSSDEDDVDDSDDDLENFRVVDEDEEAGM